MLTKGVQRVTSNDDHNYLFADDGTLVQKTGWYYYTQSDDEYENGWMYFNGDNSLAENWQKINGHTFYFDYNGVMVENQTYGFIENGQKEKTYLFDKNGYLVEKAGWNKVDDSWYLMNGDSSIVNGWWKSGDGTYYYFDYWMAIGVHEIENADNDGHTNYYFDQNGHLYQKQGWLNDGFGWLYVNSDSSLKEGWNNIGGEKYYFENSVMISNGAHMIEDTQGGYKAYLFDWNGHNFSKTGFAQLNGNWYLVLNDGSLAEGWQKINQDYYYFDGSIMLKNQATNVSTSENQDEYYLFDRNGRLVTTPGWYYDDNEYYPYGGVYHYVQNNQGKLADTGRYHIGKNDFYFDGIDLIVSQVIWDEDRPYYVNASGYFVTKQGKYQIDNGLSTYVKSNGQVAVDEWINLAGHWYYADQGGYFSSDGSTITKNGKVYVFDNNGQYYNTTGWVVLHKHDRYSADEYYYLTDGIAFANQWFQVNGQWYYADESGQVARNQAMNDSHGDLYYFNQDGSYMTTSGWYHDLSNDNWYLIGTDGQAVTNWFKLNNDWFFFHEDGSMETGRYFDGQKEYYFDESRHWKNNGWVKQYDTWTYLNNGATLSDGWQKVADKWYYFQNGDILVSRLIEDNGTIYTFDQYGNYSLGQKGWYYSAYEPAWYYLNDSHSYVTGWKKINNTWYYFGSGDSPYLNMGAMFANFDTYINGQHYLFDNNGAMVTKGQVYDQYLSVSGGVGRNVWVNVSGTWYYYDNDGFMLSDGVYNISGVDYYFNEDGKNVEKQGWLKVHDNGQYSNDYLRKPDYYYMENNKLVKNQWRMINKNWYYFDQDGLMAQGTRLVNGKYEQFSNNGSWIKG